MSDYEDADFVMEPRDLSPKRKAKKNSKKKKTVVEHQKRQSTKTRENVQKKKKKPQLKEAMKDKRAKKKEKRKEKDKDKKKGKKKKKNKLALNVDTHFKFTEGSSQLAAGNPSQNEKLNSFSEKPLKEPKRKKTVAFGSLPSYIRIKRPVFSSSTPRETQAVREVKSCSTLMGGGQMEPQDDDIQDNSDDMNSQDLFITQKTFRASPSEASSSEAGDRLMSSSPHLFTQRNEDQLSTAGETRRCNETSDKKGQDGSKRPRLQKVKMEPEEDFHELRKHSGNVSLQTNPAGAKKGSEHKGSKLANLFLDDPLVINPTPDAALIQRCSSYCPIIGESPVLPGVADASTQTENFFTTELSSCLSFCRKTKEALRPQDVRPLDLSLPKKGRENLHASVPDAGIKQEVEKCHEPTASLREGAVGSKRREGLSASPVVKHAEVRKEPSCQGESTPSPQSEAETKSANTTTSSEDDHHCHSGKRDLTQVGAVQLRLNKPFFFKTKGDKQSPRPESPLMKLAQGREDKPRTGRSRRM